MGPWGREIIIPTVDKHQTFHTEESTEVTIGLLKELPVEELAVEM